MRINKLFFALFLSPACFYLEAGENSKAIEPIMVNIPAGSFEMGATNRANTQPVHQVDLAEFSLGK